ncbi:phosphate ABC transporter permease subunit PstC [Bacteriovorax sp. DB6_IX]|uniref:phosphate ABC transporter permease subunit PstC n=1 Tax=Bacteriovorax sp. DB6_IX TaxID=1353530 RepID=UPI001E28726A|nr:phosphate ABC transporter permease subunit PstC [Bacteriovorax sp. DB6_IX]
MVSKDNIENNTSSPLKKRGISYKQQDKIAFMILRGFALAIVLLLGLMIYQLFQASAPAIKEFGFSFIYNDFWNPIEDEFGALPFIYGTLVTSLIAILIAAPVSIAIALFINEYLPKALGNLLGLFVELISAIPSIIFGLWGLYYLAPWVKDSLTPILKSTLGFLPLFSGPSFGIGILTASIILSIMIIPTITSVCREVFKVVPSLQKEAALALGATKFEAIKLAILKPSFSGVMGAVVLGLGRALGETMAVAMVIGNSAEISKSLFGAGATMASVMANEYAEADSEIHLSALCLIGLLLFVVTFFVNFFARSITWKAKMRGKKV